MIVFKGFFIAFCIMYFISIIVRLTWRWWDRKSWEDRKKKVIGWTRTIDGNYPIYEKEDLNE